MRSLLRSAIAIGTLALGAASPLLVAADGATHGSGVVWRLSGDGDWLVGLHADAAAPTPLRPMDLRPSYAQPGPAGASPRPAIVLRLDGRDAGSEATGGPAGCALPFWMTLGSAGACLGTASAPATGLSASLGWSGTTFGFGAFAGTSKAPVPAAGSLSVAPRAATTASSWPLLVGPAGAGSLAVDRYGLDGRVRLGEDLGLNWSASVVHAEAIGPALGAERGFDQQALSLGLTRGTWTGGLTGRVTRPRPAGGPSAEFGAIDLEVAWVTPWEGELSFGAENLILRGQDRQPALPAVRSPEAPARTPFVRYRQDF